MKKVGHYTARGVVTQADTEAGFPQKIPLFDGSFKSAYKVTNFRIWAADYGSSTQPDVIGKLSKNDQGTVTTSNFMRADDDNQIAWAASAGSTNAGLGFAETPVIDRDNLVVEDLFVYALSASASTNAINYIVEMEKYSITDWQGALAMARARAKE